jgi:hypothetical protein
MGLQILRSKALSRNWRICYTLVVILIEEQTVKTSAADLRSTTYVTVIL